MTEETTEGTKQIEIAIRAAQTAKSVLDLLSARNRLTAGLMWAKIVYDIEGLRKAVHETWPE
jgi:hypothetical protein